MNGFRNAVCRAQILGVLLSAAVPATAITIHYTAVIEIDSYNSYLGNQLLVDPEASVSVEYDDQGNFEITAIDFNATLESPPAPVTLHASPTIPSVGTISQDQAECVINWEGITSSGLGTYNLVNHGGEYAATISGPFFRAGDILELQASNFGTINPPIAGLYGDWIHESAVDEEPDPHYGTRIIFGEGAPDTVPPDFDFDGDVDQLDLNVMRDCRSGPALPATSECLKADFDDDSDVDLIDFALLQRCLSGEGIPADPDCVE